MFISTEEMQDRFRKEFKNIWLGDFLNYLKEKILPKVRFYASEALPHVHLYWGDAGQVQEGVREHLARGLSQLLQGEDPAQGRILRKRSVNPMFISTEEMQDRFRKEFEKIWP